MRHLARLALVLFLLQPARGVAQTATAADAKIQAPELAAPQRGSLAGQLASTAFGPADLSRGAFTLPSPFTAPEERGPLLAKVFPSYSPDAGISEWGIGWTTTLAVVRSRLVGDIDCATDDLTGPWGRMVAGNDGYWYPIGLSTPVRGQLSGDTFTAWLPDGSRQVFGGSGAVVSGSCGTYAWHLAQIVTPTNRETLLVWKANASGRLFLASASYGGVGDDVQHRVDLGYAQLSTAFAEYRSGAALLLDQRVSRVTVSSKNAESGAFEERWHDDLAYLDEGFGPGFYLQQVQRTFRPVGSNPAEKVPPVSYTYNLARDHLAAAAVVASPKLTSLVRDYGSDVLQPTRTTGLDADLDGLADLEHNKEFALLHQGINAFVYEPLTPAPADAFGRCRRPANALNPTRVLALMAGDDTQYVVDMNPSVYKTSTALTVCNRVGQKLGAQTLTGDWSFSSTVRLVDLNRDHKPDLISISPGAYRVLPNTSSGTAFSFGTMKQGALTPNVVANTVWIHDFNGDAIPDIVARTPSVFVVWYGRGNFQFDPNGQTFAVRSGNLSVTALGSYAVTFMDANKDGLADLLLSRAPGNGTTLYLNRGGGLLQDVAVPALAALDSSTSSPTASDFTGSGNAELAFTRNGIGFAVALDGPKTGLLASADDGKGTVLRFDYERAAPWPRLRQRHPVLSKLTVESSGYDSVAYHYDYQGPRQHTVGKFLLGFDHVTRSDLNIAETIDSLNEDRYAGVFLGKTVHDAKAPAADFFEVHKYDEPSDEPTLAGIPFKRLRSVTKGYRNAAGSAVTETSDTTSYVLDVCPETVQTTLSSGVLTVTKGYIQLPAFGNSLACLVGDIVEEGSHPDPALKFEHETSVTRNAVGLVTKVESVSGGVRWVLQDVTYDAENRLETAGAPGRGTTVFKYDYERGTRLLREIDRSDGVVATATERDPLRDQLLTLRTTRGAESYHQFFQYDGQERLQSRRDDLGAASKLNPNERYTYRYATASVPASVYLSTLVHAESASVRERIELATAAAESIGTVARVPEGWAFGRLSKRSRSRGEEQGSLLAAVSAGTDPAALDYASLFAEKPIDFTSASELAGVVEQRTTYHAGVERRTTTDQAIKGGVLASTSTENETYSTSTRADASNRVLSFDDEAGVRYSYVYDALGRVRQVLLPDGRKHTASYDGHGRPSQIVREGIATIDVGYHPVSGLPESKRFSSPSGDLHRTVTWGYDAIGRVTEERHLDSTGASKVYTNYWDGATPLEPSAKTSPGLLTAVIGDGYSKLLEYRIDGALRRRFVSLAGWRSVETSFGYVESNEVGSRTTRVFDGYGFELSRTDWHNRFDSNGRPWVVELNGKKLAEYGYDANGLLEKVTFATGEVVTLDYDGTTRRLIGSGQETPAGTVGTKQYTGVRGLVEREDIQIGKKAFSRQYLYWPRRFLESSTDLLQDQDQYGYGFDSLGLPTRIDRNGTSTSIVQSGNTISAGSLVSQLDTFGRTVVRGDLALQYGPDGQVASAQRSSSTWSFVYDEAGQRRLKIASGRPVAAYLDEGYLDESGLAEPFSVGGRLVGLVREPAPQADPVASFLSKAGQQSLTLAGRGPLAALPDDSYLDASGFTEAIIAGGKASGLVGDGGFQTIPTDLRGTVLAEANLTPRVASPFGRRDAHPAVSAAIDYVQKGYDADLGLVRMGVRDYDPEINRFTTPDPLYLERPELCLKSPVECSLYSYALNAPLQYSDPAGRSVVPFVDAGFILFDIGAYVWHSANGEHAKASVDLVALGLDAAFALLPGPPGAGLAARGVRHVAAEVAVHASERELIQGSVKALQVGSIAGDALGSMMKNNGGGEELTPRGGAGKGAAEGVSLTAGKNFKEHFVNHRAAIERALGIKVGRLKEGGGEALLKALSDGINNGTFKLAGQGTLKKESEVMNIYRGNGLTVVTKPNGEWVTTLTSGEGLDLAIRMLP